MRRLPKDIMALVRLIDMFIKSNVSNLAGCSHAEKWTFEPITSIQMSCIRRLEYQTRHHCTRTICRPLHRFYNQIEIYARYDIQNFFYPSWSLKSS